ncbi:hypothetical protein EV360DRAFT_89894 [Lentinula raphanica]|nr:hypothetical protein EV360DRAFT_89894 [Lentinula raphanica]
MARRSCRELRALYAFRRLRPTSCADGPGFLYAYVDRGHLWKIGMSNNFTRRKEDWDRQCPSIDRIWMPPVASRWHISFWRFGAATDLVFNVFDVRAQSLTIPQLTTNSLQGRRNHVEIFRFAAEWLFVWENIVYPLLIKAAMAGTYDIANMY